MKRVIFGFTILALCAAGAFAQERIAVFPFEILDHAISENEAKLLYQDFSNQLTDLGEKTSRFEVVHRQDVEKLFSWEASFQMSDLSARVKTAEVERVLNGTWIFHGTVGKSGTRLTIVVSTYQFPDLKWVPGVNGNLRVSNVDELFDKIPDLVSQMEAKLTGSKTSQASQPAVPPGFVFIRGGTFTMGRPRSEAHRDHDEVQHQVTVSDFYMSAHEVTLSEYTAVMRFNPNGDFQGANIPAVNISWYDAVEYCNQRSISEGLQPVYDITYYDRQPRQVVWDRNANGYRLPTEAEWEYACRAGTTSPYNTGDTITNVEANFDGITTLPVESFSANDWDLYEMHGNRTEWC
jgi:formylglycine-generating enzyme required for sulfatase activity